MADLCCRDVWFSMESVRAADPEGPVLHRGWHIGRCIDVSFFYEKPSAFTSTLKDRMRWCEGHSTVIFGGLPQELNVHLT